MTYIINNTEIVANSLQEAQATFDALTIVQPSVNNIEVQKYRRFLNVQALNTRDTFQFKNLNR